LPIVIHTNAGQIIARGERLSVLNRIKRFFGLPVTVTSFFTEDVFTVVARGVSYYQTFSDAEFERRRAEHEEREAEARKHNPNPGPKPRLVTPR
jgi:hypothetical protein